MLTVLLLLSTAKVTPLQTKNCNNIAVKLHAWISNTPVHATFAWISVTNIRKSPSCNISKNPIRHELWMLSVLLLLSTAEITPLQTKTCNNIAVKLHAWISNTPVHATFVWVSVTNIRKSPSCNISINPLCHELWMLDVLLQLSTAEMFADTEAKIYKRHCVKSGWVHTTTFHLQHNRTLAISLQTASLTEPTIQYIKILKPWQRRHFATSPIDTATPQANQRLETRHVRAEKRTFHARLHPILTFSTRYQTGWNVTKCHACHAKRHDNLLGKLGKGEVLRLPHRHGDATGKRETRD